MTGKKYIIISLSSIIFILLIMAILVLLKDPFFHYRKPNSKYVLNNEWYQNDGIVKHFNYDAIITGTSMTENFKTSEFDKLFNANSIKVPYAGAMFKEINDLLITASNYNKNIKLVLRCIDLYKLNEPKDKLAYEEKQYPTYLYDDNPINDFKYLTNKYAIANSIQSIVKSINNDNSTPFDEYASWYNDYTFSKESVKKSYYRKEKSPTYNTTDEDYKNTRENVTQNIIELAKNNPNIDFYLFYPPYSIYYWDNLNQNGVLNLQLDCIEYASKLLLEYPNIHLYSFINEYDIINDLDNYKDIRHYSEKINSIILTKIQKKENLITNQNYKEIINEIRDYYNNYDYNKLF